tara:strand:- start:16 stop:525 length:510 start_codon:yes stop_codon:yes gene_type:complete
MSLKLNDLNRVYVSQLKDMYSAENQLIEALPKMVKSASNAKLKKAFSDHLEETKNHVTRLDQIFKTMDFSPGGHKCKAMEGLIKEGAEIIHEDAHEEARDAALICAAQKVEHYEIATYGTLREFARTLGNTEAYDLLTQTLEEERNADTSLTDLAESTINQLALAGADS